jgi:HPt (histidine-containing phosphotransfer) domain-containing protein
LRHWYFRQQHKDAILPLDRLNTAQLLMRVGYNIMALEEIIELFSEDKQRLLQQIHTALLKNDALLLKKTTHELKGICSTLSTKELKQITIEIEIQAHKEGFSSTFPIFERLKGECNQIHSALKEFQKALQ